MPAFTYFTPAALDAVVKASDEVCDCCGQRRGHLYTGPFYTTAREVELCPHCIADGSAAAKYQGSFNDIIVTFDGQVIDAEAARAPQSVIDELLHRTPGYQSWQGNRWAFHCGDGGIFQGDATDEAISNASNEAKDHFDHINGRPSFDELFGADPRHRPSTYHFKCRQCAMDLFLWDMD
ncbi:MAG: CbrC family protein [Erythrobacter sp.]|uniref:CbrC family protein n=1 Tax=Erythrobacter sp. TaxID=1042 RepID=UPI0025F3ECA7|nr:CbrC family protein [Erythrobacter sp.]MCM0001260.1 CbrC family protein [Erythrobacter sp.]